jgi:hypothetical protein
MDDEMHIAEAPQRWLFYVALDRGRTRSPATWTSYAEALHDWLRRARPTAGSGTRSRKVTCALTAIRCCTPELSDGPRLLASKRERTATAPGHVLQLGVQLWSDCATAV